MDYNVFIMISFGGRRLSIKGAVRHIIKYFVSFNTSMSDKLDRGDKNDETST